jgi:putative membrane protein
MESPVAVPHEAPPVDPARIYAIERPDSALLALYAIRAVVFTGAVFFPLVIVPLLLKYFTLRYRFDEHGVAISWGYFFRRETFLTYVRIQDIHLTRSFLERWLGIGTVEIQTASANAAATESLVGLRDDEAVRDFLYQRMRGHEQAAAAPKVEHTAEQAIDLLTQIRDQLRSAREGLAPSPAPAPPETPPT